MVLHFSQIPRHRTYVLHWYRYTLRNCTKYVHSVHLQQRVRRVTKVTMLKHKSDKSSWNVYKLLRDMKRINSLLVKSKTEKVWRLLTTYMGKSSRRKKRPSPSVDFMATNKGPTQDPERVKSSKILADYLTEKQGKLQIPSNICDKYKAQLILPLALHEHALRKLQRIEFKLAAGPPKVSLNYTAAGKARIWFVRSALNKGRRQSRALGRLIRSEKRKAQKNLDYWGHCQENSYWAWHEALWENLMETGCFITGGPEQFMSWDSKSVKRVGTAECNDTLNEWLEPIKHSIAVLHTQSTTAAKYYENFKHGSVLQAQRHYFTEKALTVFMNRKRRYNKMLQEELQFTVPFFKKQNLPSIMKSYKF
ncbi:LADA_0A05138g1_1 [Lachancea dasiensis]|uniref:LADA_0A05138g1_1 n=1 Tax=Lachancea dasiensis TaxID=1072105 RepID=A0A1G4INY1_9SACH|nr:LADA_0A05138g1_1 [Lachancea dasiensis]